MEGRVCPCLHPVCQRPLEEGNRKRQASTPYHLNRLCNVSPIQYTVYTQHCANSYWVLCQAGQIYDRELPWSAGSAGGLAKNFATLVEILGTYAEVRTPEKDVPLQTSRVSAAPMYSEQCWHLSLQICKLVICRPLRHSSACYGSNCYCVGAGIVFPGSRRASIRRLLAWRAAQCQSCTSL